MKLLDVFLVKYEIFFWASQFKFSLSSLSDNNILRELIFVVMPGLVRLEKMSFLNQLGSLQVVQCINICFNNRVAVRYFCNDEVQKDQRRENVDDHPEHPEDPMLSCTQ